MKRAVQHFFREDISKYSDSLTIALQVQIHVLSGRVDEVYWFQ